MKLTAILTATISATALAAQPDIILDNADANSVEFVGPWADDTTTTNAFRGSAKVITSTTANTAEYARFHTMLPTAGPWKVFVWHNGRSGFGDDVAAKVTSAENGISTGRIGQNANGGQWFLVGTYWFNTTQEAEVRIEHDDAGQLSADAVRFSLATPDTILDSTGDSTGIKLLNAAGTISSATWPSLNTDLSGNEQSVRRSTTVGSSVEFSPSLPAQGDYDVWVWLPRRGGSWVFAGSTGVSSVSVDVVHRTGTATLSVDLPTDLGQHEGGWVRVGTAPYRFDTTTAGQAGGPGKIIIKGPANAGECVPADAVRLAKVGTFGIYQDDRDPAGPPGVVLGTKQAGQTPNWFEQTGPERIARRFLYYHYQPFGLSEAKANNDDQRATFTPPLPEQGLYDIYLWYPWGSANAATTLLTVHGTYDATGTGVNVTRTVNQALETGKWTHVGRYVLDANLAGQPATSWLTLEPNNNGTNKFTKADAVLFLRDGEETDADADGLPDWKEVLLGTSTSLALDANGRAEGWDTDNDGMSDGDEYRLGRNPLQTATSGVGLITLKIHTPTTR